MAGTSESSHGHWIGVINEKILYSIIMILKLADGAQVCFKFRE
jgi:hypothetical protein